MRSGRSLFADLAGAVGGELHSRKFSSNAMNEPVAIDPQLLPILEKVPDPEVPVLTVVDLGIVREAEILPDGTAHVKITPTYSGCPAMNMIEVNLKSALQDAGYQKITVQTILHPAWTTDWMSENGKQKLKAYGIAPPLSGTTDKHALFGEARTVPCPNCDSTDTRMVSQFGSTACKAHYVCKRCLEPFDYFKCL